jgi:hypothetical protein
MVEQVEATQDDIDAAQRICGLPADPNQIAPVEIPEGMVPWDGRTKEPPEDWDGGAYLCRDGKMYFLNGWDWGHGTHCDNPTASWDRIAYTIRAALNGGQHE